MAAAAEEEALTDYERERLATIARNTKVLEDLGLQRLPPPKRPRPGPRPVAASPPAPRGGLRRSSRVAPPREDHSPPRKQQLPPAQRAPRPRSQPQPQPPAQPGSSRAVRANLAAVDGLGVGAVVPGPPTKASVMALAHGGRAPSFNKYSGAVEWANAVFLFVNVDGEFNNVFQGDELTWFGGARQHEGTPVIRRLLEEAVERRLFCRAVGGGGPASPYVYCGALDYARHQPDSAPLEVVWRLRHRDDLVRAPAFRALLSSPKAG